jgi:hypothetical protein
MDADEDLLGSRISPTSAESPHPRREGFDDSRPRLKDTVINLPRPSLEAQSGIPSPEKKETANRATSSY